MSHAPDIAVTGCRPDPNMGPLDGDDDQEPLGARIVLTVALTPAEAHARAAHKIERDAAGGVTLAAENRPMADAIADKLVADGFGT